MKLRKTQTVTLVGILTLGMLISGIGIVTKYPAAVSAAGDFDGRIVVELDSNPSSPATVTATRAADVDDPAGCGTFPAETITLTKGTGPKATNKAYTSPVLNCSGNSNNPAGCRDADAPYYKWNISVTGSFTGSAQVTVACGGTQIVTVASGSSGPTSTTGSLKGIIYSTVNGPVCNSNSVYVLAKPGKFTTSTVGFNDPSVGTPLRVDSSGNYTINGIKPGTYELFVDCIFTPNGASPQDQVVSATNIVIVAGKTTTVNINDSSEETQDDRDITACDSQNEALGWIVCRVIDLVVAGSQKLDGLIQSLLSTDLSMFNTKTDQGKAYYAAWNTFRIFGIVIIVVAGLIMIISQALGMEIFDAYTIRKVLPRLFVAIIAISLSWYLLKFVIGFFNDVGVGIQSIIYYPFREIGGLEVGNAAAALGLMAGAGAFVVMTSAGVLSLLATAGLGLLIAFGVLIIRQLVVVFLILIAPFAIACFVLPNTERWWKLWYDTLLKMLMMFPIIMGIIAVGHVFGAVATHNTNNITSINQIIGVLAFFLPYFLLPFTFRLAGGAIATIAGIANDRSRGAFDRLRNFRGNRTAQSMQQLRDGTRFNNRALNATSARLTTSRLGLGRRGKAAYEQKMALSSHEFARSAQGQAIQFNDPALQAMTYGSATEARAKMSQDFGTSQEEVESAIAAVRANGGFGRTRQVWAAKQLAATGTGYADSEEMYSTIARVAGGNVELGQSMWGEMRGTSERAGRNDLKAGYSMGADVIKRVIENGDAQSGTGQVRAKYQNDFIELGVDAARGVDNMSALRNKPKSLQNMMRDLDRARQHYSTIATDPTVSEGARHEAEIKLGQVNAKMENLRDHTVYGPEVNAEAVHGARVTDGRDERGNVETTDARRPGIATSLDAAQQARSSAPRAQEPYQEERLSRLPSADDVLRNREDDMPPPPEQ